MNLIANSISHIHYLLFCTFNTSRKHYSCVTVSACMYFNWRTSSTCSIIDISSFNKLSQSFVKTLNPNIKFVLILFYFIYIFIYIFDDINSSYSFYVNVAVVFVQQKWIIRYNMLISNLKEYTMTIILITTYHFCRFIRPFYFFQNMIAIIRSMILNLKII